MTLLHPYRAVQYHIEPFYCHLCPPSPELVLEVVSSDSEFGADSGRRTLQSSGRCLYCTTLQHHVWRTIVLRGWSASVERVAQRSPQHRTFNQHFWQTSQNATGFCFMRLRRICDSLVFNAPYISFLTYLLTCLPVRPIVFRDPFDP